MGAGSSRSKHFAFLQRKIGANGSKRGDENTFASFTVLDHDWSRDSECASVNGVCAEIKLQVVLPFALALRDLRPEFAVLLQEG
jgi:hypothetical protein